MMERHQIGRIDYMNMKAKRMTAIREAQADLSPLLCGLITQQYMFGVAGMGKRRRAIRDPHTGEITCFDFSDRETVMTKNKS